MHNIVYYISRDHKPFPGGDDKKASPGFSEDNVLYDTGIFNSVPSRGWLKTSPPMEEQIR